MGLVCQVLHGHFGPVYLHKVGKNDDEKRCFLKQFGFNSKYLPSFIFKNVILATQSTTSIQTRLLAKEGFIKEHPCLKWQKFRHLKEVICILIWSLFAPRMFAQWMITSYHTTALRSVTISSEVRPYYSRTNNSNFLFLSLLFRTQEQNVERTAMLLQNSINWLVWRASNSTSLARKLCVRLESEAVEELPVYKLFPRVIFSSVLCQMHLHSHLAWIFQKALKPPNICSSTYNLDTV